MTPAAPLLLAACLALNGNSDRVTARDLSPVFAGLADIPPDTEFGLAPAPAVVRWFHLPELRQIAARFALAPPDHEICVQRPVAPPDPEAFRAAMRETLPQADIEILEFSQAPIPEGAIRFPAGGLRYGTANSMWNGYVEYARTRRFPIWARVKVKMALKRVIATEDLRVGQAIQASQIHVEMREQASMAADYAETLEQAIGKCPRVTVRAGSALRIGQLDSPVVVARGETIRVTVQNGQAHLELEAAAESAGTAGALIRVRNPATNRRFLARVEGKGKASVDSSVPGWKP